MRLFRSRFVWTAIILKDGKRKERMFNDEARARACYDLAKKRGNAIALCRSYERSFFDACMEIKINWLGEVVPLFPLALGMITMIGLVYCVVMQ